MGKMITDKITANERYRVCKECDKFINLTKQCSICKCFMPLKVRLAFEECPKGKWTQANCAPPGNQAQEDDLENK